MPSFISISCQEGSQIAAPFFSTFWDPGPNFRLLTVDMWNFNFYTIGKSTLKNPHSENLVTIPPREVSEQGVSFSHFPTLLRPENA